MADGDDNMLGLSALVGVGMSNAANALAGPLLGQSNINATQIQARRREMMSQMSAMTAVGSAFGTFGSSFGAAPTHPKTGLPLTESDFYAEVKDGRGRMHSINGQPGRKWSDGYEEFFWHGVLVPELVVRQPEQITVGMIEVEENSEVRRVMIERYGQQRYMVDCGAALLSKDETGELYKKNMGQHEEPLVFVKVKNSTPEPDGSIKDYFLRVPPTTKTARAGVAWTFGLESKTYSPQQQT